MSFAYQDDAKTIIYRAPADEVVTIPNQVKEIYGLSDGDYAFMNANNILLQVIFQKGCSLQKISDYAFYNCYNLKNIDFSMCTQLEEIGKSAFRACSAAQTIVFPKNSSLKSIKDYGFTDCRATTTIDIPASVNLIGAGAFQGCKKLTTFKFDPESRVKVLPNWVFQNCISLESIYIPKMIGAFANIFTGCNKLLKFEIDELNQNFNSVEGVAYSKDNKTISVVPPGITGTYKILDGVTKINWCSFCGSQITNVIFPDTLEEIVDWAFSTAKIQYAYFPDSFKKVGQRAFSSSALIEVTFPSSIDTIGDTCFFGCRYLKSVKMPDNFTKIGGGIFAACSDNLNISFSPNSELKVQDQKIAYTKDNSSIILYFGDYEEITIKNFVESIKSSVFYQDKNLKRVVFEKDSIIKVISESAFHGTNLTEIVLPDTVTHIYNNAFMRCSSLQSVTIGSSISFIGYSAFSDDPVLSSVVIKGSKYIIEHNTFRSCEALSEVDLGNGPTNIGEETFYDCKALKELTIPKTVNTIGAKAFAYSGLTKITFAKDANITEFTTYLFDGCNSLETIVFPDSVKSFGTYCFSNTDITNFVIPSSLESIGEFCFNNCGKLTTFTIPSDSLLKSIGFSAFSGCYSFETIVCNNNKEFCIINGALYDHDATKLIVVPQKSSYEFIALPETIKTIGQSAFLNCTLIKQIFFPSKSVNVIEDSAFESCINLININIPSSVNEVRRNAFKNCKKLQCGLLIQSQDKDFRSKLVNVALMPKRCLEGCERICSVERKFRGFQSLHSLLFISMFGIYSE